MKYKQYYIPIRLVIKLLTIALLTIIFFATSCSVQKAANKLQMDSTMLKKSSMAIVSDTKSINAIKEEQRLGEENEWQRLTLHYPVSNNPADSITQLFKIPPATIIYETGRYIRHEKNSRTDSNSHTNNTNQKITAIDSINRKTVQVEKVKRSTPSGLLPIKLLFALILIIAGYTIWKHRSSLHK